MICRHNGLAAPPAVRDHAPRARSQRVISAAHGVTKRFEQRPVDVHRRVAGRETEQHADAPEGQGPASGDPSSVATRPILRCPRKLPPLCGRDRRNRADHRPLHRNRQPPRQSPHGTRSTDAHTPDTFAAHSTAPPADAS